MSSRRSTLGALARPSPPQSRCGWSSCHGATSPKLTIRGSRRSRGRGGRPPCSAWPCAPVRVPAAVVALAQLALGAGVVSLVITGSALPTGQRWLSCVRRFPT